MRAWISCKAEPDPVGSPASARRHPRTAPCQQGTAEEPGEDNAVLQGGNQWPFICFTPHVRLSVPKALWKQTLLNSGSGKCLRALPATRRQHVTPRQPRPWQPAGSPCPRRAQSGCAAGAKAGWMQTGSGHTAQSGGTGALREPRRRCDSTWANTKTHRGLCRAEASVPGRGTANGTGRATCEPRAAGSAALGLRTQPGALLGSGKGVCSPKWFRRCPSAAGRAGSRHTQSPAQMAAAPVGRASPTR